MKTSKQTKAITANWSQLVQFCAKRLGYTIDGKQGEILQSYKQIKVIRSARRTGKSFNIALITYTLLCYSVVVKRALNILYAAPRTEDTRHMWQHLHTMLDKKPIQDLSITFDNYASQSNNKKRMVFSNGTTIRNATCDNPEMDDIRGGGYDFLAVDEFGNIEYKQEFIAAATQGLKDKDRLNWLMIVGTPDLGLGEEFDRLFDRGQVKNDKIQSWHMTEADCPFLDKESAEVMNSLLDDDSRLREVEGEAIPPKGRLFNFDMNIHVASRKYDPNVPYFMGMDLGRNKPVCVFAQAYDDHFHILRELSGTDILIHNFVNIIQEIITLEFSGDQPIVIGYDKAGNAKSDLVSFTAASIIKTAFPQARSTSSSSLVNKTNQVMLFKKLLIEHRLTIEPSCKKLISSFLRATPAGTKHSIEPGWAKTRGTDDPLDSLAYALINYRPGLIISSKPDPILLPEFLDAEIENALEW